MAYMCTRFTDELLITIIFARTSIPGVYMANLWHELAGLDGGRVLGLSPTFGLAV